MNCPICGGAIDRCHGLAEETVFDVKQMAPYQLQRTTRWCTFDACCQCDFCVEVCGHS
jgi:hypothetical protein